MLTKWLPVGALVLTLSLLTKRFHYMVFGDVHIESLLHCSAYGWKDTSPVRRRIFDAFPVNSEIDLLMARLHELNSTVDHFILSRVTCSCDTRVLWLLGEADIMIYLNVTTVLAKHVKLA